MESLGCLLLQARSLPASRLRAPVGHVLLIEEVLKGFEDDTG